MTPASASGRDASSCSRFVQEVVRESTGETVGEISTFRELLERDPETDLRLWEFWYFG